LRAAFHRALPDRFKGFLPCSSVNLPCSSVYLKNQFQRQSAHFQRQSIQRTAMPLIACRECQQPISTDAARCPQCGAQIKSPLRWVKWAVGVPVVILLGLLAAGSLTPESHRHAREVRNACLELTKLGAPGREGECYAAETRIKSGAHPDTQKP